MNRFKRAVLWAALIAVILLTLLSIYGAFIGADRARAFFTSLPLAVYWLALIALLVAGIVLFRRLLRVPSLLLMHLGCILVLLGAMWGSNGGHALARSGFSASTRFRRARSASTNRRRRTASSSRTAIASASCRSPCGSNASEWSTIEPGSAAHPEPRRATLASARRGGTSAVAGRGIGHSHHPTRLSELQDRHPGRPTGRVRPAGRVQSGPGGHDRKARSGPGQTVRLRATAGTWKLQRPAGT